jgi:transcriptional regulator with XRE-family HTH domain
MAYPGEPLFPQHLPEPGEENAVVASAQYAPSAVRRWIALELKRLRLAAGREAAEAGERLNKTAAAYRHYENNQRSPSASDIEVLLNWYGVPERTPFFRELIKAAQRGKDWWISFATVAVPDWFELYLGLETGAARISSFDLIIPGLLQTREYAEALYRAGERRLTDEEIHAKVELRIARQAILARTEDVPQVWSVLDESALRRMVGGPQVMRDQLQHLLDLAESPHVEIQVLPHRLGAHAGVEGTFTLLDYGPEFVGDPGTVYIETRVQGIYYEDSAQVTDYRRVFERLQVQAERPAASLELIKKIVKDIP